MPLYEYRCTKCGHRFERIQHFDSEPELECPRCCGLLERPLTAPALQFKGAGWYVNDYASKSAAKPSDGASESAPAETKKPAAEGSSTTPSVAPAPAPASTPSSNSST